MPKIRKISVNLYERFLKTRHRFVKPVIFLILLISLVVGAGYRAVDIKKNFGINGGFEFYVEMASHFWTEPGGYNFEEGLKIKENPDDYVFTHYPKEPATASFENEKGWEFILSLIFKEGTRGIQNLAMTVVRYQMMLDLLVIILLFFAGRSIAGPLGGSFAAVLYALFKPSIMMMSWVSYYYWSIPFSALSLLFWAAIYKPESRTYSLKVLFSLFFLYGVVIGFATSLRLSFLFLPLFLSPLIFFRERNYKRSLILILAMLMGQGILLVPQVLITQKYYDRYTLSVRGKWHNVIQGLGAYPNPFGVKDSADLTAIDWVMERGGPDLNKVGIQEYDKFVMKEIVCLFKERPDIFLRNFKTNFCSGIAMTPKDRVRYIGGPAFFGILDTDKKFGILDSNKKYVRYDPKILKLTRIFPWLVLFSLLVLFFFRKKNFGPLITVVFQGFYMLGILCVYFPPADVHTTNYFPVFVLLLSVGLAVLVKGVVSIFEGSVRYRIDENKTNSWSATIKKCFQEDWDKKYCSVSAESAEVVKKVSGQRRRVATKKLMWLFIGLIIVVLLFMSKNRECAISEIAQSDDDIINTILRPETNGGFESWSNGKFSVPSGWVFPKQQGIRRATGAENVKIGTSSVEVEADKTEATHIIFCVPRDKLYSLLNKNIIIDAWIKSANKSPDKVYIYVVSINGRDDPYNRVFYQNSGQWEKLKIPYKVPVDTQSLYIMCVADAGTSAYFDGVSMRYKEKLKRNDIN